MSKRNKRSQNNLFNDFNTESDDFVLVDLQTTPIEQELSPVPLITFLDDEEAINSLLVKSCLETQKEDIDMYHTSDDTLVVDDSDVADDFPGSNRFVVGPIDPIEDKKFIEPSDNFVSKNATFNFNEPYEDLQSVDDSYFVEKVIPEPVKINNFEPKAKFSIDDRQNNKPVLPDSVNVDSISLVQETVIKKPKTVNLNKEKNINQNKVNSVQTNNTSYFNYISLGIGSVALLLALVATNKVLNLQGQVSKLTDLTSILEEDVSTLSDKNSNLENTRTDLSVEQLKQIDKKRAESDNIDIKVKEKKNIQEPNIEKNSNATKVKAQPSISVNTQPLNAPSKNKVSISANKSPPTKRNHDLQKKSKPDLQQTKKTTIENKKTVSQQVLAFHRHKPKEAHKEPNWFVNLVSFKDQKDAKRKAVKLIQQGIPVRVSSVQYNRIKWYQLKVGGFKNKANAASYATKVKKSLNLNMVSVSL